MTYTVKSVKHVEEQKEEEEQEYWTARLADDLGETISIKSNKPIKFSPGDKMNFDVKSKQMSLVSEK